MTARRTTKKQADDEAKDDDATEAEAPETESQEESEDGQETAEGDAENAEGDAEQRDVVINAPPMVADTNPTELAQNHVKPGDLPQGQSRAAFIRAQERAQWAGQEKKDDGTDPDQADVIQRVHSGDRSGDQ